MRAWRSRWWRVLACAVVCAALVGAPGRVGAATSTQIVVSGYGVSPGSLPYAIITAKGYFKDEGLDVTIRSAVGSDVVRTIVAGDLPYGEASVIAVIAANEQGANLRIISGNINTMGEVIWVTMPNSPIKTINDIRGKRIAFTTPLSATQALTYLMLERLRMKPEDVQLVAAGGFPQALTALEHGGVDVATVVEPLFSAKPGRYRALATANQVLPVMANVLGLTTAKHAAQDGDLLRAILRARARAVKFIIANPAETAKIAAPIWSVDTDVMERVIRGLIEHGGVGSVPYFGEGKIYVEGIENMIHAEQLIGVVKGDVPLEPIVDQSFLPTYLKTRDLFKK
jgi:NitT/TauT family transport system substrate-binding protein